MLFTLILLLFSNAVWGSSGWETPSEPTYHPSLPADGIVEGVNVISGIYLAHEIDFVTKGLEPFTMDRCYCRDRKRHEIYTDLDSPNLMGWHAHYDFSLWFVLSPNGGVGEGGNMAVSQRSGGFSHYYCGLRQTTFFPTNFTGYMNHTTGVLSGQCHHRNTYVARQDVKEFHLYTGDGTIRCYKGAHRFNKESKIHESTLAWERKPSGNLLKLENGGYVTYSSDGKIVLNWVGLRNYNAGVAKTYNTSDNRTWTYLSLQVQRVPGTPTYLLSQVVRPDGESIYYHYNIAGKRNDFILGKDLPEGRFLKISYSREHQAARDKVNILSAPLGVDQTPFPKYRFYYGANFTDVLDAVDNQTRYEYDADSRITRVIRFSEGKPYREERNVWDEQGSLRAKVLLDGAGKVYLARKFLYDDRSNVVQETIYGNLTGTSQGTITLDAQGIPQDHGTESYTKKFTYSPDRFNLLTSETDGVATTCYVYYPETNLLKSKLILEGNHIRLRQFRAYDVCAALTLLIEDDGNSPDQDNLAGCTQRKITRWTTRTEGFGVGQPERKEEKYYDLERGCEVLLKATTYHYDRYNDCVREDVYDSTNTLRYEIHRGYDAMGQFIREIDACGNVMDRKYDLNGNLVRQEGPQAGVVIENTYDYSNRLIVTRQGDGRTWCKTTRFRYDLCGQKIAEVDGAGNETRYVYDALGRVKEIIYPATLDADDHQVVSTVKKTYDLGDNITCWTDERGDKVESQSTIRGQPFKSSVQGAEEHYAYDLRGNLIKKTAPDGSTTLFTYDFLDRIVRTEQLDAKGKKFAETSATYSAFGLLEGCDPEGVLTRISYDGAGRECTVCVGEKRVETSYSTLGFPETIKEFYGEGESDYTLTRLEHDFLGRVLEKRVEDSAGNLYSKNRYRYDGGGHCIESVEYLDENTPATTFYTYDALGRVVEKHDPNGNCFRTEYEEGHCQIETDPLGSVRTLYFDARQRKVAETVASAGGDIVSHYQYRYDGVGNRIVLRCEQKPDQWQEVRFKYAWGGKMTEVIPPDLTGRSTMRYDAKGQLIYKKTPLSEHTFEYDAGGHVILHVATGEGKKIVTRYAYDKCGRVTEIDQDGEKTLRQYDGQGNIVFEQQQSGHVLTYMYDRQGRRTRMTLPDGSSVRYSYLGLYLASVERCTSDNRVAYMHTYTERDLRGKILGAHLPQAGGIVRMSYDLKGNLSSIDHPLWDQQATYDPRGNLLQLDTRDVLGKAACAFVYDSLNQLLGENDTSYSYDGVGNPSQATVGPCNQLLQHSSRTYSYDANGRLNRSAGFTCTYDPLDRMIAYNETKYSYDGLGRRICKDGTTYLYDGNREIGTIKSSGSLKEFRLLGEGLGAELGATLAIELDGDLYPVINDIRGNPTCCINRWGTPEETYRYTAFGETTIIALYPEVIKTSVIGNAWRFSSKRFDPESGWIFFGRRYYSPTLNRFTTPDPLGYTNSLNLYTFVSNNPLTHCDLFGYYDSDGEHSSYRLSDFIEKIFEHLMSCIEWIGKNLIPIPGIRDVVEAIGRWGTGGKLLSLAEYRTSTTQHIIIPGKKIPGETFGYTNGQCTPLKDAIRGAEEYSKTHGNVEVHLLYNSTAGLFSDSLISGILKFLGGLTAPEKLIIEHIRSTLQNSPNEIIHIVAHSQGGLHLFNAGLHLTPEERGHIQALTFGSCTIIPREFFGRCTNFISRTDLIPLTDSFGYLKATLGITNDVTFLKPTHYNPLKEHSMLETTYREQLTKLGNEFQRNHL